VPIQNNKERNVHASPNESDYMQNNEINDDGTLNQEIESMPGASERVAPKD